MFKCELCGHTSEPLEKVNFVLLKKRSKEYDQRAVSNKIRDEDGKWKYIPDNGGEGFETVKEVKACGKCAAVHSQTKEKNA